MKRTIAFIISFTLSFLFFFSSTAMAEEVQVAIPEVTSQSIKLPPVKVDTAFFATPKPEIKIPFLQELFTSENQCYGLTHCTQAGCCTINNDRGYYLSETSTTCLPCPT